VRYSTVIILALYLGAAWAPELACAENAGQHFPSREGLTLARKTIGTSQEETRLVFVQLAVAKAWVDKVSRQHLLVTAWAYGFQNRKTGTITVVTVKNDKTVSRKELAAPDLLKPLPETWEVDIAEIKDRIDKMKPVKDFPMQMVPNFLKLAVWQFKTNEGMTESTAWFIPLVDLLEIKEGSFGYGETVTAYFVDPEKGEFKLAPASSTIEPAKDLPSEKRAVGP